MRVLIVNTSERTGGAAVAANRLLDALNNNGIKAKMLVRDKESDDITVVGLKRQMYLRFCFLYERLRIFLRLRFSRKHLFHVDIANIGADITSTREFKEADIIHLHWVNQGMLSLGGISKILESGKPLVWTMHDVWPATSICHLSLGCTRFKTTGCKYCKYLPGGGSPTDLSAKIWRRKKAMLDRGSVYFVACSKWLAAEAKASILLKGHHVTNIPNPIDTRVFCPQDRDEARRRLGIPTDARVILFVSQRADNPYKGMNYLVEACNKLASAMPDTLDSVRVAVLGGNSEDVAGKLKYQSLALGYVGDEDEIASVYAAADVFVLPSLSENLPNTIMEAMACGIPCVGFNVGGIPEMIDHRKNGYVAAYKQAADLAAGLRWVLFEADGEMLKKNALAKVASAYSQQSVALKYIEVYNEAYAYRRYRL